MSVIKCPGCGMQMGADAFDNCPTCNEPLSVTVLRPDQENDADKLADANDAADNAADAEAESESESEAEAETEATTETRPVTGGGTVPP